MARYSSSRHQKKNTPQLTHCEKWHEAFRIYAGIFSKANPKRAIEIWQHVENIKAAADSFSWESVHEYDQMF